MKIFLRSVFGMAPRWEVRLIFWRLVTVACALGAVFAVITSPWKALAGPLVSILFIVVVASIVYQWVRRYREERDKHRNEENAE
jgi:Flp pilus assembly protein TadB